MRNTSSDDKINIASDAVFLIVTLVPGGGAVKAAAGATLGVFGFGIASFTGGVASQGLAAGGTAEGIAEGLGKGIPGVGAAISGFQLYEDTKDAIKSAGC